MENLSTHKMYDAMNTNITLPSCPTFEERRMFDVYSTDGNLSVQLALYGDAMALWLRSWRLYRALLVMARFAWGK